MRSICTFITALVLTLPAIATAATTATVVDIPTRGVTQRILYLRPDAPTANLIVLPGGTGFLNIQNDGSLPTPVGMCNPPVRNRQALADRGFAVAVVDASSDLNLGNYADLLEVLRYMQGRDAVPTWMVGGSTITEAALDFVIKLPMTTPLGAVFYSPEEFTLANAAFVKRPSLVIYHPADGRQNGNALFNGMTAAPVREAVALTGGLNNVCAGYHTFNGLDGPFVDAVSAFIGKYNPTLVIAPPAGTALAVEFYNAALDHYFLTHIANEIAQLDAGTTIKGWVRTGQSFNVYPAALANSSPVCRFYIPPLKGDSHFYGRGTAECGATAAANPTFVNEDPQFFHVVLPAAGVCPAGTRNVFRVFSNRPDANHRYMVDSVVRDQMVARNWLAEGDGPDLVVMCAPM